MDEKKMERKMEKLKEKAASLQRKLDKWIKFGEQQSGEIAELISENAKLAFRIRELEDENTKLRMSQAIKEG